MYTHIHTPTTHTSTNVYARIPIWWAAEYQVVQSHPASTHTHIHTTTHTYILLHTHIHKHFYTHIPTHTPTTHIQMHVLEYQYHELRSCKSSIHTPLLNSHSYILLLLHTHTHTWICTHTYYYYYTRKHMYILEYQYDVLRSCKSLARSPLLYTHTYILLHTPVYKRIYTNTYMTCCRVASRWLAPLC